MPYFVLCTSNFVAKHFGLDETLSIVSYRLIHIPRYALHSATKVKFYTCSQCFQHEPRIRNGFSIKTTAIATPIRLPLTFFFFFCFSVCSTFRNGCDIKCNIWTAYEGLSFYYHVIDRPMKCVCLWLRVAKIVNTVTKLKSIEKKKIYNTESDEKEDTHSATKMRCSSKSLSRHNTFFPFIFLVEILLCL